MHTAIHPLIETHSGTRITIVFNVRDAAGNLLDLEEASAEYRLARRAGERALMSLGSGGGGAILIEGSAVHITLDTTDLPGGALGDFFGQLRLTIGGQTLVAAEGPLCVHPVILPAEESA